MAVCNLFCNTGDLKDTGTFLTFSQYLEDLTHHHSDGVSYSMRPSSFFVLNLDFSLDDQICEKLMTYVENYCACLKSANMWSPEYFYHILWQTLRPYIKKHENLSDSFYGYKGDITIQSFNEINGMGYSEIYCHVPYTSKKQIWTINTEDFEDGVNTSMMSGDHLEGYPDREIEGGPKMYTLDKYTLKQEPIEHDDIYSFNTIVVFYDVFNGTNVLHRDIPLGIFFTGKISGGVMSNAVTITPNSQDVFYSGSSYGLKICTRFATDGESGILNETEIQYDDLSLVLEQISKSQALMTQMVEKCNSHISSNNDLYLIFKNSRANVPYIKDVNVIKDGQVISEPHWFVNGRDLGYSIYDEDKNKL